MATSLLEPRPPSLARQHYRSRIHARTRAVRLLRFVAGIATLVAITAGLYLGKRGFGRQWRERIIEELNRRGVDAEMRRLTLDPFRGLVAQDVRIFDPKNHDALASISEVAVDINYAALIHHQPFLNAIDVRNARLTIPLSEAPGLPDRARLTDFNAHVLFPPEQIFVTEAQGSFAGVRISARGQLIRVNEYRAGPETSEQEWRRRMQIVHRVLSEISRCSFPAGPAKVELKFSADLAAPQNARATATVRAERIQRGSYTIGDVSLAAEWAEQKLVLNECDWRDTNGRFSARASWDSAARAAELQASSSLNLRQFLEAAGFGNLVGDFAFTSAPTVEVAAKANFATSVPEFSVVGRAAASNFSYKTVPFSSLTTDFSWDGARTMLRDVHLRQETGELIADVLDAPGDFRLRLESNINPAALRGIFPEAAQHFLSEWDWQRAPRLRLTIRGTNRTPETWNGDGSLEFEHARFRNVPMNSASATLRFGNHAVNFDNFRITRDEGAGTGSCAYDFARHEVRLTNVKTNLRPTDAIIWIEPKLFKEIAPYKFHQLPSVSANGVVQFHGGTGDHLQVDVDAPSGMDYVFLGKTLSFERTSARLLFTNDRLQIFDMAGTLFGGSVRGTADISLAKGDPHYRANINVDGIDFPALTELYFKYHTSHGRLAGSLDWTGVGDNARALRGAGKVRVSEGNVFAIPVFGPLSSILGTIFPGAGYSVAHEAIAEYTINDGVIHTDNFKVSGKLFGMLGHGDIRFVDDRLDFDLRISANGAGVVLTPVYKLFEYHGEGSISKPNWHAKNF